MKRFKTPAEIRTAVVGYGPAFNMGRHHMKAMKGAGMTPVAVADIDPSRLPVAEEEFPGVKTFNSAAELLANCDVDFVGIITPHNTHAELAVECLEAGKHVITEKPFAITTDECDTMIAAAKANDVMLSVHHNRHWDGWILNALDHMDTGMVGDIVRVEAHSGGWAGSTRDWWRNSKSISGGIAYDWGSHFLEYALQLIDDDMVEVSGFAKNGVHAPNSPWGDDTIEDETYTVVRLAHGQVLTLLCTRIESHARPAWFDITGTKGSYRFSTNSWQATVQEGRGQHAVFSGPQPGGEAWRFYKNICAHLIDGEPLIITAEWARRNIHILDLADRSAREGRTLPVVYP